MQKSPVLTGVVLSLMVWPTLALLLLLLGNHDPVALDVRPTATDVVTPLVVPIKVPPATPATATQQTASPSTLPAAVLMPEVEPYDGSEAITGALDQGETLTAAFKRVRVPDNLRAELIASLDSVLDFRRLNPGDTFEITFDDQGAFQCCTYESGPLDVFSVTSGASGLVSQQLVIPLENRTISLNGVIDSSLFAAFVEQGETPALAYRVADIFASKIDFNTETRQGDRFQLLFEKIYKDDTFVGYGRILAARFNLHDQQLTAFYYAADNDSIATYFDSQGEALDATFIRSPLPFSRVTSGFSLHRMHPILKTVRPHLGVDLAAPIGTPVMATADGHIDFVGKNGGFGNQVIVKHRDGFRTHYGHLSRFKQGLKKGQPVRQRQVIGYVGATGLATGPHLDYRVQQNGRFKNPFAMNFAPAIVLTDSQLERFHAERARLVTLMKDITDNNIIQVRAMLSTDVGPMSL